MKTWTRTLLCAAFIAAAGPAAADWFVSSDVKALTAQAAAGDADAQFKVAVAYDSGKGAPQDGKEAMKWYRLAAEQGMAEAQNSVGSRLQAERRYAEALPWYEKAAAQGHAQATNNLAYLHDLGLGVPQDRRKGFEIYMRAADLGWAEAMWNIANLYGAGQLGEKDMVSACIWTLRARRFATPEQPQLQHHMNRMAAQVERMLTPEQWASCDKQWGDWEPKAGSKPAP